MDDAAYLFKKRTVETKRLARGAYAKKGGSRSKKCSLPSDHMTKKEWKERNGKTMSYKMREPMSWADFKAMPRDLQDEYLQYLIVDKKARCRDVAEMFGIHYNYFGIYCDKHDLPRFPHTGRRTPSDEWLAFIGEATPVASEPTSDDVDSMPTKEPDDATVPPPEVKLLCSEVDVMSGTITYKGLPAAVFERAYLALNRDDTYVITVSFHKIDDEKKGGE